ncbi:MAG: 1-deoxy-D-xylulose-5-phosphate synthase [Candidatus Coproplasma sp.]
MTNILNGKDIKNMSLNELTDLCDRLRSEIIDTVMKNGGHLSSNLGAIELTVALYYVFDFPQDKLIFDVGHQCYAHKLLSDRPVDFSTIRKKGGLSGFPKRDESEYDAYDTGHAGTSISAALGIAKARDIKGERFNVISVIGDGSFNNGLVYEAFNSLRPLNTNVLVILNDNGMSISPTVGSMHEYLEFLSQDDAHKKKVEKHANIFERFGFLYDGVYDGNNLEILISKLTEIKEKLKSNSIILHILTKKGKGYSFCEENPEKTHGISSGTASPCATYSKVLGDTLCNLAQQDSRIVAVTAAMTPSLGLSQFFEKFPERAIDVGICEEHATILCAALATQGLKPYYAVYSTFLQRSFDEILIDICSQHLPVTICLDRSGISGEDGETHQGVFDLSFLRLVPSLTIAVPKDVLEFETMLKASVNYNAPLVIRYPKESISVFGVNRPDFKFGKWEKLCDGDGRVAVLACGERVIRLCFNVKARLEKLGINIKLINARSVKPFDEQMLSSLSEKIIVTVEDNQLIGGFGDGICSYFAEQKDKTVKSFAYRDEFIEHGTVEELMVQYGVSEDEIADYIIRKCV